MWMSYMDVKPSLQPFLTEYLALTPLQPFYRWKRCIYLKIEIKDRTNIIINKYKIQNDGITS